MEEQSQLPVPGSDAVTGPNKKRKTKSLRWDRIALSAVVVVLLGTAWQAWTTREELRRTQVELARRMTDGDSYASESRALARKSQESMDAIQAKLTALDDKVDQAQSQYSSLENMYSEFSRAKDERALAEVEQAVDIANQQLQLASNVPAAIAALQSADNRLALMDQVRFLPVRKLVARDIDRLKALPLADVTAMALQLDAMLGRIDSLPLSFERAVPGKVTKPAKAADVSAARKGSATQSAAVTQSGSDESMPAEGSPGFFKRFLGDLWAEFSQLIRIERLDQPDPALMAPSSATYLRENIRLRLLSARLALLQRDGKLLGEDVRQARAWLERYFDTSAKPVAELLSELQMIDAAQLAMSLPSLDETAMALRNIKLSGKR